MPQPNGQTRRRRRQPPPYRPRKIREFDTCAQNYRKKVHEFLEIFTNVEEAQDDQHWKDFESRQWNIIGLKSNCMMLYYSLSSREQRDPNAMSSKEEMDTASERFMKVVREWKARRAIHLEQNPIVINLTGNNSNSNSNFSSGSSRSGSRRNRSGSRRSRSRSRN